MPILRRLWTGQLEEAHRENIQDLSKQYELVTNVLPEDFEEFGIIRAFVFDGLPGLDRWCLAPPDLTHDLCEGVIPEILEFILTSLLKNTEFLLNSGCFDGITSTPLQANEHQLKLARSKAKTFIKKQFESFKFYEDNVDVKWDSGKQKFSVTGKAIQVCNCLSPSCLR